MHGISDVEFKNQNESDVKWIKTTSFPIFMIVNKVLILGNHLVSTRLIFDSFLFFIFKFHVTNGMHNYVPDAKKVYGR